MVNCPDCRQLFSRRDNMLKHMRNHHANMLCDQCERIFFSKSALKKHIKKVHEKNTREFKCMRCSKVFGRSNNLLKHSRTCMQASVSGIGKKRSLDAVETIPRKRFKSDFNIIKLRSAFNGAAATWRISFDETHDFVSLLKNGIHAMEDKLSDYQKERLALKFTMALHLNFEKSSDPSVVTEPPVCLVSEPFEVYAETDISSQLMNAYKQLLNEIDVYERNGSGWIVSHIEALDTSIWELDPLRASSYHCLPQWVINKRAVRNIKNRDNQCFKWAVIAGLNKPTSDDPFEVYAYRSYERDYDWSMLTFPVLLKDIKKFEVKNNISINVYGCTDYKSIASDVIDSDIIEDEDDDEAIEDIEETMNNEVKSKRTNSIHPLKVSEKEIQVCNENGDIENRHVNLLLTEKDGDQHYSVIASFSRLLRSQISQHHNKHFFCYRCLHGFTTELLLNNHKTLCQGNDAQREVFPYKDPMLKFINIKKQLKAPFVCYADAECILKPQEEIDTTTRISKKGEEDEPDLKTKIYQEHIPYSFCYKIVSIDPNFHSDVVMCEGENVAVTFIEKLQFEADNLFKRYIAKPKPMIITQQQELEFQNAETCHICSKPLGIDRVRDHCHILGYFRGAAHNDCNLQYAIKTKEWKLPVLFHNLRGYDSHLIIKNLNATHGRIRVIPNNMETYMAFSVGQLQFLDSFQFLNKSLEELVSALDEDDFTLTHEEFPIEEQFNLVRQKGIYPYDYLNSWEKFDETSLPIREDFHNKLNDKDITKKQYAHAEEVWDVFGCETMKDYHDVYLKTDVLLLADVFEKFRKICMLNYGLDPVHYYTSPGMAWDAALKMSNVNLELITDIDQYKFIEKAIRGGISMISTRYAQVNNPYVENYDSSKPTTYIIYLDANNLYGQAMIQFLPTGGFRFLPVNEITRNLPLDNIKTKVMSLEDEAPKGYIFDVDMEYPEELHDNHSDYPLAPEGVEIMSDMLSPFQESFPKQPQQKKLTPNLWNKKNYVVHFRNLKLYLEMGMRITKVNRVLEFDQSAWLKPYIDFNTQCRAQCTTDFEKNFYKLMSNSVFGKTQENLRKRVNVELITKEKILKKRVASPRFKCGIEISEELTAVQSKITTLMLNRPIYVGFCVLELSKLHMYNFHYKEMLSTYPGAKLMFTDTDSLTYLVETADIYKDMVRNMIYGNQVYDMSDYPDEHPCFQGLHDETVKRIKQVNKKVVGKMKDEFNGTMPIEFAGLLPKLYSFLYKKDLHYEVNEFGEEEEVKKPTGTSFIRHGVIMHDKMAAKGIKLSVKKAHLRHHHYVDCLKNLETYVVQQNLFRSRNQTISSINVRKDALSAFDNKRWIHSDGIHTYALGHWRTNQS